MAATAEAPFRVNPPQCMRKEFTQVNKRKRRAVAIRPRFLSDDAYRAEVLAVAGADAEAEVCERQADEAGACGRWGR